MWEDRTFMWVWDRLTSRTEWLLKNACWVWIYLQFYSVLGLGYVMLCMSSLVFVYISMISLLFGVVVVGELTFEFWLLLQLFFFRCFLNSNNFGFSYLEVLLSIMLLFGCCWNVFNWSWDWQWLNDVFMFYLRILLVCFVT